MGKMARVDWPSQWPQLFPNIEASLVSGSPSRRRMALCGMNEVNLQQNSFTVLQHRGVTLVLQYCSIVV